MYRISTAVRSTQHDDGALVLDIQQGQIYSLNVVGSRILELLKSDASESQIADEISHDFNVDRDTVAVDVQDFLRLLAEHKLIEELREP